MASSSTSPSFPQPSLAQIAQKLLEEALQNIIHDLVIFAHRDHKLLLSSLDPTTRLPHCERCKLPRLLEPVLAPKVRGAATDPPKGTEYCDRKPWCRKAGFDIYGNPFPKSDMTGRPPSKKERDAAKNKKDGGDGTPASEDATANGTAPPSPSADGDAPNAGKESKLEKGEKKANKIDEKLRKGEYVPWHTCPSCKRSLLITRFAKHLEQCMGLSGRAASRNAMAKMNGSTPAGSRGGTPNPGAEGKGDGEDDEDEITVKGPGGVRKKLLKKNAKINGKKDGKLGPGPNGKLAKSTSSAKRPPGGLSRASPAPSSVLDKRDRDEMSMDDVGDDDDTTPVKKRQKLDRVSSMASVVSSSTAVPLSAIDMERRESNDGSFVDEGSVIEA